MPHFRASSYLQHLQSLKPHLRLVQQSWQAGQLVGRLGQTEQGPISAPQSSAAPALAQRVLPGQLTRCC